MTPIAYIVAILALAGFLAAFACLRARRALVEKAEQSRRCLASLSEAAGLEGHFPVTFVADLKRLPQFVAACFRDNPFPRYRAILCFLRLRGVEAGHQGSTGGDGELATVEGSWGHGAGWVQGGGRTKTCHCERIHPRTLGHS